MFNHVPSYFNFICIVNQISLVCLLFGYRTKISGLVFFFSTIFIKSFLEGFLTGYGKNILYDLIPLFLSFSGWGNKLSIDAKYEERKERVNGWPIYLIILTYGFCLYTSAIPKLTSGWLSFEDSATYWHILRRNNISLQSPLLIEYIAKADFSLFWEVLDYMIVLFEFTLLFIIPFKRIFRYYIGMALFFHIGIILWLKIPFLSLITFYVLIIFGLNARGGYKWLSKLHSVLKIRYLILTSFVLCVYSYYWEVNFPFSDNSVFSLFLYLLSSAEVFGESTPVYIQHLHSSFVIVLWFSVLLLYFYFWKKRGRKFFEKACY
ncbi:MAG: hypothetical protein CME62_12105 [Halobacteriovoraceae bacterium]|nr:hypothetical protein [Halobacteriovoraceae bacterium]